MAQYTAEFFDEAAAERRRTTKPKQRRRAKSEKAPPVIRLQRKSAALHLVCLDRMIVLLLGIGLIVYMPDDDSPLLTDSLSHWCCTWTGRARRTPCCGIFIAT